MAATSAYAFLHSKMWCCWCCWRCWCGISCRYAPEKIPYAVERYTKEAKRLLGVLEARLKEVGGPYIMGQDYTIAGAVLTG